MRYRPRFRDRRTTWSIYCFMHAVFLLLDRVSISLLRCIFNTAATNTTNTMILWNMTQPWTQGSGLYLRASCYYASAVNVIKAVYHELDRSVKVPSVRPCSVNVVKVFGSKGNAGNRPINHSRVIRILSRGRIWLRTFLQVDAELVKLNSSPSTTNQPTDPPHPTPALRGQRKATFTSSSNLLRDWWGGSLLLTPPPFFFPFPPNSLLLLLLLAHIYTHFLFLAERL